MTTSIQIYANDGINVEVEHNTSNVLLKGIDVAQVVNNFSAEEVLACIELSEIHEYLKKELENE